ncbi:Serine/threonine-protein kinase KIPK1, partial [Frankliniella fusca]
RSTISSVGHLPCLRKLGYCLLGSLHVLTRSIIFKVSQYQFTSARFYVLLVLLVLTALTPVFILFAFAKTISFHFQAMSQRGMSSNLNSSATRVLKDR